MASGIFEFCILTFFLETYKIKEVISLVKNYIAFLNVAIAQLDRATAS